MSTAYCVLPFEIISDIIQPQNLFPNNSLYPLLIYRKAVKEANQSHEDLQILLHQHTWHNSWVNGIYDYHHYHSNTHEVLIIYLGKVTVQIGGHGGKSYEFAKGDVVIIPAGVAHKNQHSSSDFKCIGAYPDGIDYDMNYGKAEEHPKVDKNIKQIGLPKMDPIFGKNGPLFEYWNYCR